MKIAHVALALAALVIGYTDSTGGENWDFHLAGTTKKLSGKTAYDIKINSYLSEISADVIWESRLEFPLNVYFAEVEGELTPARERGPWSLDFSVSKNINSKSGSMTDADWYDIPMYGVKEQFSSTSSDSRLDAWIADAKGRLTIFERDLLLAEAVAGIRYEYFAFELTAVRGWQDFGQGRVYFSLYPRDNVLDYEITYAIPYGGVSLAYAPSPQENIRIRIEFSPVVGAWDRDDHILRNKLSTAHSFGTAVLGGADITWGISPGRGPSNWFLGFGFDGGHISTKGEQTQEWYDDDPISQGDETGMKVSGIDDYITNSWLGVTVFLGRKF
jgi:outer membrane protease